MEKKQSVSYTESVKYSCIQKIQLVVTIKILYFHLYNMLILKRFIHRHSRSFFVPNGKRENPLNECEKTFVEKVNPQRENPLRENPLNECEKTFQNCFVKKYENPLNECEKSFEKCISKKI